MNQAVIFTPLTELIKAREFDLVSPGITDERFPAPNRLWNNYRWFHFGEGISSEEVVKRMQAEGYEPANSHELLSWDEWNEESIVIALGSSVRVNGNKPLLYLCRNGWARCLYLTGWYGIWNTHCHFLAVCGPSGA